MDPPEPASAEQSKSSSSSSSIKTTIPSGPQQEPEIVDLSSDENSSSQRSLDDSLDSDSDSRDTSELKFVRELREMLDKREKKVQKRKKLRKVLGPTKNGSGGLGTERVHQEPGCSEKSNVQLSVSPLPSTSASLIVTKETEGEREELKRKLEMVTAELSRSRMKQVKKIKRSAARQPLVIEVPDFPMEYYNQVQGFLLAYETPGDWYLEFNNYVRVKKQPEYIEWIQSRTTEFLPKVLDIMTTVWNKTTPVTSQLNTIDLLKCRLVSKSWKRSVDKLIQEPVQNSNSPRDLPMLVTKVCSTDYAKLSNFEILVKSSDALTPHPFPSRSFIVSTYPHEDGKKYTKKFNKGIDSLLLKYGIDLHHFGYHGHGPDTTSFFHDPTCFISSWTILRGWLKKMPNLKSLQITLPRLTDEVSSKEAKMITSYQIPKFDQLVAFECRRAPSILLNQVLRRNKTVEKLECFQLSESLTWTNANTQLKNLSEFSMDVSYTSHIVTLGKLQWPLRKLALSRDPTYQEIIELGLLFATLGSFQKTLQELTLKLWITCSEKNLRLELPHLKSLDLILTESSNENKISYDFLLPLDHLEILKLGFEGEERETEEVGGLVQVIQLRGYLNRLYESNVWKLFPCLKKVEGSFCKDGSPKKFTYVRDKIAM